MSWSRCSLTAIHYLTDQHAEDGPGESRREYAQSFNRLILFNTSQKSWHRLSRKFKPIAGRFRTSLASCYVSEIRDEALTHTRALFAARVDQREVEEMRELIKQRADENTVAQAYLDEDKGKD